jgi:hypothetical protein
LKRGKNILNDSEEDKHYKIIGIVSAVKDFKLAWLINRLCSLNLFQKQYLLIPADDQKTPAGSLFKAVEKPAPLPEEYSHHSVYYFNDEMMHVEYYLYTNQGTQKWLAPEMKNIDYFLLLKGAFNDEDFKKLLKTLRSLAEVSLAVNIVHANLPSRVKFNI